MANTPFLDLVKPTVDDPDTDNAWGYDLNENFDKLDTWASDTGTIVGRNLTISTSDPSGGSDGDLWFKVS